MRKNIDWADTSGLSAARREVEKKHGSKAASLTEEQLQTETYLTYLAELLVEIYLADGCEKSGHKERICENCRWEYSKEVRKLI